MSEYVGPWVEYRCANDCRQEGCPGHKVRSIETDTECLVFEDEVGKRDYFDDEKWAAMVKSVVPCD
jgi:hypothetical protein